MLSWCSEVVMLTVMPRATGVRMSTSRPQKVWALRQAVAERRKSIFCVHTAKASYASTYKHKYNGLFIMAVPMASSYTFPHSTCEPSLSNNGWLAVQPASACVTGATTFMLAAYAHGAHSDAVRVMLATFAAFQGLHMSDHLVHIPGSVQAWTTHALGYCMYINTLAAVVYLSPKQQLQASRPGGLLVLAAVALDVWACTMLGGIWMIGSGLGVFAAVVLSQWASLPKYLKAQLPTLLLGVAGLLVLFANEAMNCQRMLQWWLLPYHAAIEVTGCWLFYRLAVAARRWDAAVALEQRKVQPWYQPLVRSLGSHWHVLCQSQRSGGGHLKLDTGEKGGLDVA